MPSAVAGSTLLAHALLAKESAVTPADGPHAPRERG
jgi:hypothetical protein